VCDWSLDAHKILHPILSLKSVSHFLIWAINWALAKISTANYEWLRVHLLKSVEHWRRQAPACTPFCPPLPVGTYSSQLAPCLIILCNNSNPGASRAYYRKRVEEHLGKYGIKHSSILNHKNEAEARAHAQDAWYIWCLFVLPHCSFMDP